MPAGPRVSYQGLRVLRVFLVSFSDNVRAELAGAEVMKAAGISSGTLYPILLRFERGGLLESRWEDTPPEELGRPRRRFYRLTSQGVQFAHDALRDLAPPLMSPRTSEA